MSTILGRVQSKWTQRGSCKLCLRPNVAYISINLRKNKFSAYIYIRFNQNLGEKSYISAKNEALKHLHALFLLTADSVDVHSGYC